MFKFITSKPLWINILIGIFSVVLLILLFFGLLDWITGHAEYEKVPNVTGQTVDAARLTLQGKGFSVEVLDSVYDHSLSALSVVKQAPEADASVKHGRTIYLTINRASPPLVEMPNLIGFSVRSAEMYLVSLNLKMGDTTYKPDIARNAVLEQLWNGSPVKPGTRISVGSTISFVLGSGVGSGDMVVPDILGLTVAQAKNQLATLNLNVGSIVAMTTIRDTANAFIVRQTPEVFSELQPGQKTINKIRPGQLIDIYISVAPPPVKDSIPSNH